MFLSRNLTALILGPRQSSIKDKLRLRSEGLWESSGSESIDWALLPPATGGHRMMLAYGSNSAAETSGSSPWP